MNAFFRNVEFSIIKTILKSYLYSTCILRVCCEQYIDFIYFVIIELSLFEALSNTEYMNVFSFDYFNNNKTNKLLCLNAFICIFVFLVLIEKRAINLQWPQTSRI